MEPLACPPRESRPDAERGRTDGRDALRLALPSAPPEYLAAALDNPAFGPDELALVLAHRGAPPAVLARIGRTHGWMRSRDAKHALVRHPKTPTAVSRRYLPHLFWRELVEVAGDLGVSPVLRRDAERLVRLRLPELSVGERITLARVASRGLVTMLRDQEDASVLKALAGNARFTEADLAIVLGRSSLPAEFLGWLAEQSAWAQRAVPRLALVRHARTPAASALKLVGTLSAGQLDDIVRDESAPRLVRVAAGRRLGVDTPSDASLQSPADRRHPDLRGLSTSR